MKEGLWGYPYQITPKIAANLAIDSSLLPITFMLVYQYTSHKPLAFYFFTSMGAVLFSFGIKPLLQVLILFWLDPNMNYLSLLGYYLIGILVAIIINKSILLFIHSKMQS